MNRSLLTAATLAAALTCAGGAFAQQQAPAQPVQAAPNANLIPGGAAAAAPSFMDRLAYNIHSAFNGSDSDKNTGTQTTRTADTH